MWDLKRLLKETWDLDQWRQKDEGGLVRGNDVIGKKGERATHATLRESEQAFLSGNGM